MASGGEFCIPVPAGGHGQRLCRRRIRTADGCIDEVIDSYTGQVLERRRVDCAAPCG